MMSAFERKPVFSRIRLRYVLTYQRRTLRAFLAGASISARSLVFSSALAELDPFGVV